LRIEQSHIYIATVHLSSPFLCFEARFFHFLLFSAGFSFDNLRSLALALESGIDILEEDFNDHTLYAVCIPKAHSRCIFAISDVFNDIVQCG
jgi:hypothetical protein